MESLKDCTQSLLNILEKVTKTEPAQEKLETASPEEVQSHKFFCSSILILDDI